MAKIRIYEVTTEYREKGSELPVVFDTFNVSAASFDAAVAKAKKRIMLADERIHSVRVVASES